MLANKYFRIVDDDGRFMGAATFNVRMAISNYARCDSLIPATVPTPSIHYKVNLSQQISGINLSLCDGGANGCIKGNDIRLLKHNGDGQRVSIGIAGDHQLTGAPLCTAVSIAKSNRGLVKLFWHQCAEVKTQQKYIPGLFVWKSCQRCVCSARWETDDYYS